jgi:hypothetical protein
VGNQINVMTFSLRNHSSDETGSHHCNLFLL